MGPRVVFLSTSEAMWGAEHSLLHIAHGLDKLGVDVEVWAQSDELIERWEGRGRLIDLGIRAYTKNRRLLRMIGDLPNDSTVVSFDVSLAPTLAVMRPYLQRHRIRTALDFHVDQGLGGRRRGIALAARGVDMSLCVSQFMADQLSPRVRKTVVWRPMSPVIADPNPPSNFTIGIVGRIDPVKKIELALEAAAAAESRPQIVLRGGPFAGGDDYVSAVLELGGRLLGDRFRFDGRVPQTSALNGLHGLLHCNDGEPSGRVVAEAQSSGVVPIVPDAGGAPQFVTHGVTGLVFAANDPQSAATCIDTLVDPAVRSRIAADARRFAQERYDVLTQSAAYGRALGVLP
ncbi:glycosyltransferase family 4 protein [Smaragdicoccus niigatensis]|uniref:glycosyltransferase family 4 protein n=1 Tax=Smaragdicoccus niigatensis TaxID=359359 RepID=UPI000377808E|nr:glycosyltransferase family 4 protein [Smaragdicoccus niigatensis]